MTISAPKRKTARDKLLEAALTMVREKGYAATTVDELCARAGVTKGAFFHHFRSKDELGVAAAAHWSDLTGGFFAQQDYHRHADPLDRVLGYIDFRRAILQGPVSQFTCFVGTMVQETYDSHPAIRDACAASITGHAAKVEADIELAMRERGMTPDWTARSLALHTQAVLQGVFILAKATGGREIAIESVGHLRRYVKMLFQHKPTRKGEGSHVA